MRLGEVIQPRLPPLVEREEARSEGGDGGGEGTEGGGEGTEGGGGAFSGPCRLAAIANTARLRATHAPYPARVPPVRGSDSHSGGQAGQSRANPSSNPDPSSNPNPGYDTNSSFIPVPNPNPDMRRRGGLRY